MTSDLSKKKIPSDFVPVDPNTPYIGILLQEDYGVSQDASKTSSGKVHGFNFILDEADGDDGAFGSFSSAPSSSSAWVKSASSSPPQADASQSPPLSDTNEQIAQAFTACFPPQHHDARRHSRGTSSSNPNRPPILSLSPPPRDEPVKPRLQIGEKRSQRRSLSPRSRSPITKGPTEKELVTRLSTFFKAIHLIWKQCIINYSLNDAAPVSWAFVFHAQAVGSRRWFSDADLSFQVKLCQQYLPACSGKLAPLIQSFIQYLEEHMHADPQSVLLGHIPSLSILRGLSLCDLVPVDFAAMEDEDFGFPLVNLNCAFPALTLAATKVGSLVIYRQSGTIDKWHQTLPLSTFRFARVLEITTQHQNHVAISLSPIPKACDTRLLVDVSQLYALPPDALAPLVEEASPHILKQLILESARHFYITVGNIADCRLQKLLLSDMINPAVLAKLLANEIVLKDYLALRELTLRMNLIYGYVDASIVAPSVIKHIPFFPQDDERTRCSTSEELRTTARKISQRFVVADLQFLAITKRAVQLLEKEPVMVSQALLSRQVTLDSILSRTITKSFRILVDRAGQFLAKFEATFRTFHTGECFKNLRTWWLDHTRAVTAQYLSDIGFDMSPLTDRNVSPTTHRAAISKDLVLLDQLLSPHEDPFLLVPFIREIIKIIYENIDQFIETGFTILSIALDRDVDDIKHLSADGEAYLRNLAAPFQWIRGVREDLEFLLFMKSADVEYLQSPHPKSITKPAGTIPIYSIITDRLVRYRQELKVL